MKLYEGIPKRYIVADLVSCCAWSAFNCVFVEVLARLTQGVLTSGADLMNIAFNFVIFIALWEVVEFVGDFTVDIISTGIGNNVNNKYLDEITKLRPDVIKSRNTGYICGLISKYLRTRTNAFKNVIEMGIVSGGYILYCVIRMFSLHITYGIVIFGLVVICVCIRVFANQYLKKYIDALSDEESNRVKLFNDSIGNITTLQKMQSVEFVKARMLAITEQCTKLTKSLAYRDETAFVVYKFLLYMFAPICYWVTGVFKLNEVLDMSIALPLISVIEIQLIHNTKHLANAIKSWNEFAVVDRKISKIVSPENKAISNRVSKFTDIRLNNVKYRYTSEEESVLIRVPDFHIHKGDFVSISGESGQGKTTLLNLISGEIENTFVKVDDKLLISERLDCSFIAQDTEMLDMTIRDNLCMGKDIPEEDILYLIDCVGLSDWLSKQANGLDTFIGERGVYLSTGQRQRLNLIRGLLQDKELYLLDEPTSNVDDETEAKIVRLVAERLEGKTAIIVTHRPAVNSICNKEYLFENGICKLKSSN